jgi:hypothetical protein
MLFSPQPRSLDRQFLAVDHAVAIFSLPRRCAPGLPLFEGRIFMPPLCGLLGRPHRGVHRVLTISCEIREQRNIWTPLRIHSLRRSSRTSRYGRACGSCWRGSRQSSHRRLRSSCRHKHPSDRGDDGADPRFQDELMRRIYLFVSRYGNTPEREAVSRSASLGEPEQFVSERERRKPKTRTFSRR